MTRQGRGRPEDAPWPDDEPSPFDAVWDKATPAVHQDRHAREDAASPAIAPWLNQAPDGSEQTNTTVGAAPQPDAGEIRPDPAAAARSTRRYAGPQPAPPRPPRGRRSPQDLPGPASSAPDSELAVPGAWRTGPLWALLAALAWVGAVALLVLGPAWLQAWDLPPRLVVPGGWALAALITFLPLQLRMSLPGLTWQGMLGFSLLGYLLAFVPAPTSWLLELPDVPVYLLFFLALFYAVGAIALPITFTIGQRFYNLRLQRHDIGRARRQAYEIALLAVATFVMAGLRVLTPISFGLLALVVVLTEALLLSQVQPEG